MNKIYHKLPFFLELAVNGAFIFLYAFYRNTDFGFPLQVFAWTAPLLVFLSMAGLFKQSSGMGDFFRKHVFSLIIFVPMLLTFGDVQFAFWLAAAHLLSSLLSLYDPEAAEKELRRARATDILDKIRLAPAQIVILSFAALIFIGTILLSLPIAAAEGKTIEFIDAFFMATSAACVTGLTTLSVPENFSYAGQLVILTLVQVGGLGYMTLHSLMMILLGRSFGVKNQVLMQDLLDISSLSDLVAMIVAIIKYTLVIELAGAAILSAAFVFEGYEYGQAFYYGIFHAITAFCNAGISLFGNSLESFAGHPVVSNTIAVLVILGGLGFIVMKELETIVRGRKKLVNLSVHSKVAFITTFALLGFVMAYFFLAEYLNSLRDVGFWEQLQIAFFQSATTRSSGFNTINLTSLMPHTVYLFALVMFIGGNPGSCAGGIKTTTFAILFQAVRASLRGKDRVEFFDRTIPNFYVVRAISIIVISLMICSGFILLLMRLEPEHSFLAVFFEAVSAFGTVGLSLGITPYLGVAGKTAIIALMFIGRIGPLTMALALGRRRPEEGNYQYPDGRIMIG